VYAHSVDVNTFCRGVRTFCRGVHTFCRGVHTFCRGVHTFYRGVHTFYRGVHTFSMNQEPTTNSSRRNCAMTPVPYCGPNNIRRHGTKFSRPGGLAPRVCTYLVFYTTVVM